MKIVIIYDDSMEVPARIKTIIGKNSYGEIILKRKSLFDRFKEIVENSKIDSEIVNITDINDIDDKLIKSMNNKIIFHYFANNQVNDSEDFIQFLKKLEFVKEGYLVKSKSLVGLVFTNTSSYNEFIEIYKDNGKIDQYKNFDEIKINSCIDISVYQNLLYFISGGFDARYFNSLEGDNYTVTKKSKDKNKMKMEYSYYWLLPEKMKNWMVMPFDYKETGDYASYTMERLPMTDIAIRWTHGAIDLEEFNNIMDKTFYFFKIRESRNVSKSEYEKTANKLYLDKVEERVKKLKSLPEYEQIAGMIKNGTKYENIDKIIDLYLELYKKITVKLYKQDKLKSVIGHGDVFFANMLYSKEVNLLKLIDPKGALKEEELWTDPYYDIAKLSHSVCGNYDFFNTASYDIHLNREMKLELNVHFNNSQYKEIFKKYLEDNGYDYNLVRLYESSLFLSMLPLHIDNPHKVLGFILNAINILEELNKNV